MVEIDGRNRTVLDGWLAVKAKLEAAQEAWEDYCAVAELGMGAGAPGVNAEELQKHALRCVKQRLSDHLPLTASLYLTSAATQASLPAGGCE